jgi:subtilisin family serine protease
MRTESKTAGLAGLMVAAIFALLASMAHAATPDPQRYIVSFLDSQKGKSALRAAGARIELDLPAHEIAAAHIPSRALKGLRNNPHIEYIEPEVVRYPMAQTTPWGVPETQADLVTYNAIGDLTVCIIDSGYSLGHEDLPVDHVTGSNDPTGAGVWYADGSGHGTHVAGTIAALNNSKGVLGVVPGGNIQLHIVRVFGDSGNWAYSSSLIAALDECKSAGANVVNMSLGGPLKSRSEQRAFTQAFNDGVLPIAAAGNDGNTRNSYPASYDSVISVAAVDSALNIADFSQQNGQVELAAPGVAVRSTVPPGTGMDEGLSVGGTAFEATGMEGSVNGSGTGNLFVCKAVDGLGSPGDCAGASAKVCLIERGSITFAEKVAECQNQGGVAAIIYNNAPALFSGTLGDANLSIQAVGVSGEAGTVLLGLAGNTATVTTRSGGHYAFYDGTSMATPHVTGVAALVWSQDASCSNQDIRAVLGTTATDLGAPGRDNVFGHGLVQAAAAVNALACSTSGGGGGGGGGSCDLQPIGASCDADSECCSGKCKGGPGNRTCK